MDQSKCQKILRRNRVLIIRELPDLEILLSTPEMKLHFSAYEKMEIISQKTPSERGAKFLDKMEFKSPEVYQKFVTVVRTFKPELAIKLEGAEREISNSSTASSPVSNGSSSPPFSVQESAGFEEQQEELVAPVQEVGRRRQRIQSDTVEDAGPSGLTGCGRTAAYRLGHLSYEGREFLGRHFNPNPNLFNSFCVALRVEQRLVRASLKSRNPTAYLIQEFSERPEATFDRLERALSEIGKRDLFEGLMAHYLGNDHHDAEDN